MIILMESDDDTLMKLLDNCLSNKRNETSDERCVLFTDNFLRDKNGEMIKENDGKMPKQLTFLGHGSISVNETEGAIIEVSYKSQVGKLNGDAYYERLKRALGDPKTCTIERVYLVGCQLGNVFVKDGKAIYSSNPNDPNYCFAYDIGERLAADGYHIQAFAFSNRSNLAAGPAYELPLLLVMSGGKTTFAVKGCRKAYEIPEGAELVKQLKELEGIKFEVRTKIREIVEIRKFRRERLSALNERDDATGDEIEKEVGEYFRSLIIKLKAYRDYLSKVSIRSPEIDEILKEADDKNLTSVDKINLITKVEELFRPGEKSKKTEEAGFVALNKKISDLEEAIADLKYRDKDAVVYQEGITDVRGALEANPAYNFSKRQTSTKTELPSFSMDTVINMLLKDKTNIQLEKEIGLLQKGDIKAKKAFLKEQLGEEVPDKEVETLAQRYISQAKVQLVELEGVAKATKVVTAPRGSIAEKASSTLLTPSTNPLPTVTKTPKK